MRLTPVLFALLATPLAADINVTFRDGAPKDRFTITNAGTCALKQATLSFDLTPSVGKVIFDITGAGAGVEVFQPLEIAQGASALGDLPQVSDGDTALTLPVTDLQPGDSIVFTIDVDDTLGARGITVSGSEMAGATVTLTQAATSSAATLSDQGIAKVSAPGCA